MDDIFDTKNIKPMLISEIQDPFDDPNFIYELKLDGERCIAYLDPAGETELRNKRNAIMLPKVPELTYIHRQANKRCILDGELTILKNGKPEFAEIQRRSLMSDRFKINLHSKKYPATFVAFDVLYYDDKQITNLPLIDRKKILSSAFSENARLAVSRFIEDKGVDFYNLTVEQQLEGMVAKRKDSKYYFGKHTKDWIKVKNLKDDDFIICGYIDKGGAYSLIIAQYANGQLQYKGHITAGVTQRHIDALNNLGHLEQAPLLLPDGNENAVYLPPKQVCTVQWMPRSNGALNQSVFKGFRDDKTPQECISKI